MLRGSRRLCALAACAAAILLSACQAPFIRPEPPAPQAPAASSEQVYKTVIPEQRTALRAAADVAPAPPADLWDRLRAGMALNQAPRPEIARQRTWFIDNPDFLERVSSRAEPFLFHIVEELDRRGMPLELALLPIIESAYQSDAHSRRRAAGIWQFIPETGQRYGLKQNWWYDGRLDFFAATSAALDYLQALHREFNGDWLLALAAYNCGERKVAKARRINQAKRRPQDFWSLDLPRETRAYVPRLLAVASIIKDPGAYQQTLVSIANEPYFTAVEIDRQIDLEQALKLADMSREQFLALNAGHRRWATDPDGPHRLFIAREKAAEFRKRIAALPDDQRLVWRQHRVRSGETLSHIARRYRTSVAAIQAANRMNGTLIRAGKDLLIPPGPLSETQLAQQPDGLQSASRPSVDRVYAVRHGDTLWEIARRHGVRVSDLTAWNGISAQAVLRPGQRLTLRAGEGRAITSAAQHPGATPIEYRVRRGDSLWSIARRFGVTVAELRSWNGLPKHGYLQPGQRLLVHVALAADASDSREI